MRKAGQEQDAGQHLVRQPVPTAFVGNNMPSVSLTLVAVPPHATLLTCVSANAMPRLQFR